MMAVFALIGPGGGMGGASFLRLFRLVRLTRMARMARLLKAMPELMILIKGMVAASRSVCLTLVLMIAIIYFFSILFKQLTFGTPLGDQYFKSIPDAMSSLLLRGTLPDLADIVEDAGAQSYFLAFLLLIFILLVSLTVMNMLIGVLCEVVSVVAAVEREQMHVTVVKTNMQRVLTKTGIDADGNNSISRAEFQALLMLPEGVKEIQAIGVDVVGLVDYVDFIFADNKELTFAEFFEVLLSLRGSNTATVKDIVDLRNYLSKQLSKDSAKEQTNKEQTNVPEGIPKAREAHVLRLPGEAA